VSKRIPKDVRTYVESAHAAAQRAQQALDTHAKDIMMAGTDMDTASLVQLCRSYVDEAINRLEHALREAGD
jgi:heterodisulfide reductase subunit A-like polyferredoxin